MYGGLIVTDCPQCFSPVNSNGCCTNPMCSYQAPAPALVDRTTKRRLAARARAVAAFDGATFQREKDQARLGQQLEAVRRAMSDGQWRTLAEIAALADAPEASVSARIRDLRKPKFGGLHVESRRRGDVSGLWEYRVHVCAK